MFIHTIQPQVNDLRNQNIQQGSLNLMSMRGVKRITPAMLEKTAGTIGGRILRRLSILEKSQIWLAHELGLSPAAVGKWIARNTISRENLQRAALVLGVSAGWLMSGDDIVTVKPELQLSRPKPLPVQKPPVPVTPDLLLFHVTQDEARLISLYRETTQKGREFMKIAAENAPRQLTQRITGSD